VVRSLPLLHAFVRETLRLHPPVPQDTKECIEDDVWPSGQRVPKGAMVAYVPYLMGRSERLWGKDAAKFDLDKWFQHDGQPAKEPSPFLFPVFNAGPRLCLGKSVAILESSMLLSMIVQQFRLTCVDDSVTYALTVTLPIRDGLHVRATLR
jgi:cytochrome P450